MIDDVRKHFDETGALLSGHFKLSSGLHSSQYLQCAKVLQWPDRAERLGRALAERMREQAPSVVVSPAMGGLIIGQEVARGLSVRAIFAERVDGAFTLRRGFQLEKGERVAVVEDVITTGKSTREVLGLVRSLGAEPVAAGAVIDRRGDERRGEESSIDGVPVHALLAMEVPTWEPALCPLCHAGKTVMVPGSRFLPGGSGS